MPLPEWGWLLCTGIYLEDVEYVLKKVDTQVTGNNRATMRWIGSLAFLGMAAIIFFGLMLNIRGRREAEETERVRLSSELHDGICQRLAAARMQASAGLIHLAVIPPAYVPAQAVFRNLVKDLKDVLQETREISHGLHPMILKNLGLAAALRQLAQDMENDTTSIQFRRHGLVEGLSNGNSLAFYRLAQECLKNMRQHSHATKAALRLAGTRHAMRLIVWDNGIGFESDCLAASRSHGVGLRNMKARVEEAGGQLTITSRPGSTKVTATIPRPFLQRFLPMRDLRSSD
jgi:two-component system NarL family sensor kinase